MQEVKETKEKTAPIYKIEYDPKLLEEVVTQELSRLEGEGEMRIPDEFRKTCDPIYDKYPLSDRDDIGFEEAFRSVYKRFFSLLGYDELIRGALLEYPVIDQKVAEVVVRKTRVLAEGSGEKEKNIFTYGQEEEANLSSRKVEDSDRGALSCISLSLNPERFFDRDDLKIFLRHELMHVADMLDPEFNYEITKLGVNPSEECIIKNHYSLIWDIYIDSRLTKSERLKPEAKEKRRSEFDQTYRSLPEDERISIFEGLWQQDKLTNPEILACAKDPARLLDYQASLTPEELDKKKLEKKKKIHLPGMLCPLCKFPTHNWMKEESLLKEVIEEVKKDAPAWDPSDGLCERCDEVYRAIVGKW